MILAAVGVTTHLHRHLATLPTRPTRAEHLLPNTHSCLIVSYCAHSPADLMADQELTADVILDHYCRRDRLVDVEFAQGILLYMV
jgi:hypothetical protein